MAEYPLYDSKNWDVSLKAYLDERETLFVGKTGIQEINGRLELTPDNAAGQALRVLPHAGQSDYLAEFGGTILLWSLDRNTDNRIEQDPYNGVRISSDNGSNVLAIRNRSNDDLSVSAIVIWDSGIDHGGNGRERMAFGFANGEENGAFSRCNFIESSNDPAIGSLLDPPTTFKIIQTGYLNGTYGAKVRHIMDDAGVLTWNDVNGVGQLQIPMLGPQVSVLTKLVVGTDTAPTHALEVWDLTDGGIVLHDTQLTRATFLAQKSGYFEINAGGGNGVKIISDGSADTFIVKSDRVGIGAASVSHKLEVHAATGDGMRFVNTSTGNAVYVTVGAADAFTINSAGSVSFRAAGGDDVVKIGGNTVAFFNGVLRSQRTGWGTATGTPTRTTFDTASVTLPQLAERVAALIDDFHATAGYGLLAS